MSARRFRPGVASTVVTILLFPALLSLGFWQLDRAAQKRALHAEMEAQRTALPLRMDTPGTVDLQANIGRAATLDGHYGAPQFLLDNRVRNRKPGYEVLTPFMLDKGGVILVNRGWIPAGIDRERIPEVQVDGGQRQIEGRLGRSPSTGIKLANQQMIERVGEMVYRIQHVDAGALGDRVGSPLPSVLLFLGAGADSGYDLDWPVVSADTSKHEAYATQWFAMAVVLLLLYIRINYRRGNSSEPTTTHITHP